MIHPVIHDLQPVVQQLHADQPQAIQFIIDRYYPTLCYFVECLTDHPPTAELIAEESIANLWQQRQQLPDASSVISFLFTQARERSLAWLKGMQPKLTAADWEMIAAETNQYLHSEIIRAEVIRRLSDSQQPSH